MSENSPTKYLQYTSFLPTEVVLTKRKNYFDEYGNPKYIVEVDPETRRYLRHEVRLITDPEYYRRSSYILYDASAAEGGTLETVGYLINKIDFVVANRVIE